MDSLLEAQRLFDHIKPWAGFVPKGYSADFLGILTDFRFHVLSGIDPAAVGGVHVQTALPPMGGGANAEGWFEAVNWIASARAARGQYVMVTLGAHYGAQAVGAYRAVQLLNPMPCKLVAVEPEPENCAWMLEHMQTNGIDPDDHWLISMAISNSNEPIYFPVGAPGTGANNSYATNENAARQQYVEAFIREGRAEDALRNLILNNTTGLQKDLLPGCNVMAEIKLLSCVTLEDVLGPFNRVDYVESDIQQSEILVFPPCIEVLRKKVRRIHIGTHGLDVHESLLQLFADDGWNIVFNFAPNTTHETAIGTFTLNDGVLTVTNPDLG
jgi:FkbM family methyltransferase